MHAVLNTSSDNIIKTVMDFKSGPTLPVQGGAKGKTCCSVISIPKLYCVTSASSDA